MLILLHLLLSESHALIVSPPKTRSRGVKRWVMSLSMVVRSSVNDDVIVTTTTAAVSSSSRPILVTEEQQEPRSVFGTKEYWDEMYDGRGDFPADEYTWYYGYEVIGKVLRQYHHDSSTKTQTSRLLVPGIGNDPLLVDLYQGNNFKITAQDYSHHAIERQREILEYAGIDVDLLDDDKCENYTQDGSRDNTDCESNSIQLCVGDVRHLPKEWSHRFDLILEKGLLDAVYLSGDGNFERAVESFHRVLKPGGKLLSFSGVVPHELRQSVFGGSSSDPKGGWECLQDGSNDLKAGTFVYRTALRL